MMFEQEKDGEAYGPFVPSRFDIWFGASLTIGLSLMLGLLTRRVDIALSPIAFAVTVVVGIGLAASAAMRSLRKGFAFSLKWTLGFLGRWT